MWNSSPWCEAQASASSSSLIWNLSMAPEVTIASACIDLIAERGKTGRSISPAEAITWPAASITTNAPRWRFSTQSPRTVSARMGLASGKESGLRDALVGHQEAGKVNRIREGGRHVAWDRLWRPGRQNSDRVGETKRQNLMRR